MCDKTSYRMLSVINKCRHRNPSLYSGLNPTIYLVYRNCTYCPSNVILNDVLWADKQPRFILGLKRMSHRQSSVDPTSLVGCASP